MWQVLMLIRDCWWVAMWACGAHGTPPHDAMIGPVKDLLCLCIDSAARTIHHDTFCHVVVARSSEVLAWILSQA
jgi:hypothetical protein